MTDTDPGAGAPTAEDYAHRRWVHHQTLMTVRLDAAIRAGLDITPGSTLDLARYLVGQGWNDD